MEDVAILLENSGGKTEAKERNAAWVVANTTQNTGCQTLPEPHLCLPKKRYQP